MLCYHVAKSKVLGVTIDGLSTILLNSTLCSGAFIDMFIKTKKYLSK